MCVRGFHGSVYCGAKPRIQPNEGNQSGSHTAEGGEERRGERRWRDEGVLDLQLWKCGIFPQCWSELLQINEEPCLKVNYTIITINLLALAVGISI